jgi:hypothetical protein
MSSICKDENVCNDSNRNELSSLWSILSWLFLILV